MWSHFRQRLTGNGRHFATVSVVCCSRPLALTSCARPSTCLSRSGFPSALGHRGCCSATWLVADTSRAEPADQRGRCAKTRTNGVYGVFFLFRVRIQRLSTQGTLSPVFICNHVSSFVIGSTCLDTPLPLDGSQLFSECWSKVTCLSVTTEPVLQLCSVFQSYGFQFGSVDITFEG